MQLYLIDCHKLGISIIIATLLHYTDLLSHLDALQRLIALYLITSLWLMLTSIYEHQLQQNASK
jgi:hypothetical protein